jgi:hypothetical protein
MILGLLNPLFMQYQIMINRISRTIPIKTQQTIQSYKRWQQHCQQIKEGGWIIFTRKARSLLRGWLYLVGIIASAPLVLLLVSIRPFVWIRFGTMISQRIGHFAIETEAFLQARDREKIGRNNIDIIGCPEPVCNRQLQAMWERTLRITPGAWLWNILDCGPVEIHIMRTLARGPQIINFP